MADKVDLVQIHNAGDYGSEFEYDSEAEKRRKRRRDMAPEKKKKKEKVASKRELDEEYSKEEGRKQRYHFISMDIYSRHKKMINDYLLYYGGTMKDFAQKRSLAKTDLDIIRENHQFLWDEDDDNPENTWEKRLAKRYYDKLFKEYCIADLSRYKENKVAMRWRIEKEVIEGKGQFICGNKRCSERDGLRSWEVNFAYMEHGEKKNALVKLRLCPDCSYKLNYHHKKKEIKRRKTDPKTDYAEDEKRKKYDHSPDSQSQEEGTSSAPSTSHMETTDASIWKGPVKITEEKTREEEFDDYFEDMLL